MMSDTADHPIHILIVADSPDAEQLVRPPLEKHGIQAEYQRVDNETDFIAALNRSLDIVLFDSSSSQLHCGTCRQLLDKHGRNTPIILIADRDDDEIAAAAIRQGANDYIARDRLARLGLAVRQLLDRAHLHESDARHRDVFEHAPVATWDEDFSLLRVEIDTLRASGVSDFRAYIDEHPEFLEQAVKLVNIVDANAAMLRLYNTNNKRDILGSLANLIPSRNFQEELVAFAEGRPQFEKEIPWTMAQGVVLDLLMSVTYYTDFKGSCKALVHLTDITERKRAERALRDRETRYRTLVEQIPPIIYTSAPDQRIGVTYISPRIELLGFNQEEWIADPELWFKRIHPDDQKRVLAEITRIEQNDEPFRSEYRLIAIDGEVRWFLDEAMNIVGDDGTLLFRHGFMLDITERKQIEESLTARERYLELLNKMTRAILLSKDFDSTFHTLAANMAELIHADECYIARWDEQKQLVVPVATTANLQQAYPSYRSARSDELKMAWSVLESGHALAADDVYNSPYINPEFVKKYAVRSALGIPLIAGEYKLGAAIIAHNTPRHFTPDEIKQAEQAGNQVALALWMFQQRVEIQQRLRESNTLATIERALSESERVGTGEVLQLIVDSARELMPHAEKSVIHLLEPEEQVLLARAVSGFDQPGESGKSIKMQRGQGVAGKVIREGKTINVTDIQAHPDFLLTDSPAEFRSLLVAPVQRSGRPIGTISVQSSEQYAFTNKDAELLNAFAVQAAIAIENTRLIETTQQRLKEVNILYQISRGLAASLDADQLIRDMIGLLQQIFDYYHVQVYLIEPETGNLVVKHGSGYIGKELVQRGHQLPSGDGIVGHVAEVGEAFMTNNVEAVSFFKRNPLLPETQSEMAVPIKIDQRVVGVLDIQQTPPHRFTDGDLQLIAAIADQLAVVLQKASLYSTLQTSLQQEQIIRSQLLQSERLALVGRLLASVSHELNNPLQVMQYALFLLSEEQSLSPQARQDLDVVLAEAERMAALFERLRTAYRPVRMKDFQSIALNDLVEDVYTLISTHMRQKGIVFEFVPEPQLPHVSGLPDQLRQVLLNLFLNAVEVMSPDGRLSVWTQSIPLQNEVLLTIKDTGPGIDPEILPVIFDAFITSKHTGTGLGLTITHDIVRQHHGRITAENDPQGGAVFHIWLPVHEGGGT